MAATLTLIACESLLFRAFFNEPKIAEPFYVLITMPGRPRSRSCHFNLRLRLGSSDCFDQLLASCVSA